MNFCLHSSARTVQEAVNRAKRAEALGYEAIFFADSQMGNVDPYQVMALCAVNTKKIRFGTAVTKLADFEKGLGVIRDLLHDRGIDVAKNKERAGGNVQLKVGKRPVPIYISAEGPKILRVAGRTCDGVILGTGFDKRVTDWARQRVAEGAKEAGRSLDEIDLMPAGMIVVDDDGDLARKRVRPRMANRAHHNFRFTMETVPEGEAAGIQRFMDNFDISKSIEERVDPDLVTDYLLERFTIAGTPAECIAKVKRLEADNIKRILLTPPNAIYDQVMDAWGKRVIEKY